MRIKDRSNNTHDTTRKTRGAEMLNAVPATDKHTKRTLLALVDTGTSASLIDSESVEDALVKKERKITTW